MAGLPEDALRRQYHPALSPLGWHLGHTVFIETYWLRERLLGDETACAGLHALYFPELAPKPGRGDRLPPAAELLDGGARRQADNLALLAAPPAGLAGHPWIASGYLTAFLLQHNAQHLEIMRMVLAQRAAALSDSIPGAPLAPAAPTGETVAVPTRPLTVGSDAVEAFDNEQPPRRLRLRPARLGRRPVSNAEFLGFMEDGGYADARLWDAEGDAWRRSAAPAHPEHWRCGASGWYEITPEGAKPLEATAAVIGLNHFEASAYARWAGGRLPHEYEWEATAREGLLEGIGEAWEWCGNRFHPYPGFRAFPYDGYSLPWFDGSHYALRGGSRHTLPCARRLSFRNFYRRDQRHIFAGLRLVFDG